MHKTTYIFKYVVSGSTKEDAHTLRIRAVTDQEAPARFKHWLTHRFNADSVDITQYWLARGGSDVNES